MQVNINSKTNNYNKINFKPTLEKNNQTISGDIQKAKAMFYQKGLNASNPRAINLINLAENALKNGNIYAANNFADNAIKLLIPEIDTGKKQFDDMPDLKNDLEKNNFKNNKEIKPEQSKKENTHMFQDVSNDPGVSFTYATPLTNAQTFFAVRAHEAQHVGRRISEAILNGDSVNVYVSYRVKYDPNTGDPYLAGGVTRSVTRHKPKVEYKCGTMIDTYA